LVVARDAIEERRLARAVGTDETDDGAFIDHKVHFVYGDEPAESFGDLSGIE
jgi:hypothetical protein